MFNPAWHLTAIAVFLAGSAFFSGMEAAIFSLSRFRVKTLLFENRPGARTLAWLKKESRATLASILLGNLIVNTAASSIAAIILTRFIVAHRVSGFLSFVIESILMTSLLLIVGEITPKVIAIADPEFFALRFGGIIRFVSRLFRPFTALSELWARRFFQVRDTHVITDEEIKYMLNEAKKYSVLDESEERFGYQILRFGRIKVREIMTPRTKVVGIGVDAEFAGALALVRKNRHSRICVFDPKGEVIGVLYAKDLFSVADPDKVRSVSEIMREPFFVPETKQVDSLLEEFRKKGMHISVVVDEFGSFSGVITLEDILESLFGEIVDEYETVEDMPYRRTADGAYVFTGDISINEIRQLVGDGFPGPGSERLAAFILQQLGHFPQRGTRLQIGDFELVVEEVRNREIRSVRVRRK
jgi:putative hemolysin